ncbi:MAG TPA: ABC transporter substrate-binding protein [Herbaspirillum sp.]|jgi:ABC-type nitrate/sulfonate/bicarbonate transport system substrate-binding protein
MEATIGPRRVSALFKSRLARPVLTAALALAALAPMAAVQAAPAAQTLSFATVGKGSSLQWPLYIGIAKGFFTDSGIKLDLVSAPSSAAVQQWLASGSITIGISGLVDPLRAIDKGAKVSLIRIESQTAPYSMMAKPGVKGLADLRGKIVSLGGANDITRVYFERMAATKGIKRGDYDPIYAGATAARFAALQSGVVDAALLQPPFSFLATKNKFVNIGYAADYVKDFPFTGYAVNTEWGRKNKPLLNGFLAGVARSIDWFNTDAHREEAIDIMAAQSGLDRGDVAQTYDLFRKIRIYDHQGAINNASIGTLVNTLKETGDIAGPADPARFIDPELSGLAAQIK